MPSVGMGLTLSVTCMRASDESGVILHNEVGLVGWDDSHNQGVLLEGSAGSWSGVILLKSAT